MRRPRSAVRTAVLCLLLRRFPYLHRVPFVAVANSTVTGDFSEPSDRLMDRMLGQYPNIKPISYGVKLTNGSGYMDRSNRRPGIVYIVSDVNWISQNLGRVDAWHFIDKNHFSEGTYLVEQSSGVWRVKKTEREVVHGKQPPVKMLSPKVMHRRADKGNEPPRFDGTCVTVAFF